MPLAAYAERRLFGPLGITDWHWPRDPDGFHHGAGHLRLAAQLPPDWRPAAELVAEHLLPALREVA